MKVVLFCGGLGTRLREYSHNLPKPLVPIGYRPILWHVMKYYAHFGHKDFVLCLGYMADKIKDYFINYDEYLTNDFTLTNAGRNIDLRTSDLDDWRISFVDTGLYSNIGSRLVQVRDYVKDEEVFLANYTDGLTDMDLETTVERFKASGKIAAMVCPKPSQTFHVVTLGEDCTVKGIRHVRETETLVNGGYFIFRQEIYDYINEGEELVNEPFGRLIKANQLIGFQHDNYWAMDTFKEQQELTDLYNEGCAPWEVWKSK